jgi:hypothetical protein
MFPLPLSQFEPSSRLILDVEGHHFCLAATPELAAQLVAMMNTIGKLSVAAETGQPSEGGVMSGPPSMVDGACTLAGPCAARIT